MKKAIFKLNGGLGALLCSQCHKILKTGYQMTDKERTAFKGEIHLDPQYCDQCKPNEQLNENMD
jgi:NAD-dependent SIR2 family protein deacetylase